MENILTDECVINYRLKNEKLINECFDVPIDESPPEFLIKVSNEVCLAKMENDVREKEYMKNRQYKQNLLRTSILKTLGLILEEIQKHHNVLFMI